MWSAAEDRRALLGDPAGAAVAEDAPLFHEQVEIKLALKHEAGAKSLPVWGANVDRIELSLRPYGFAGSLSFHVADDEHHDGSERDEVLAAFLADDPIEVELSLLVRRPDRERPGFAPRPLQVRGVVCERALREQGYRPTGSAKVLSRRYFLRFTDPMRHYWGQHRPCMLYTATTFAAVLEQHRGQLFTLSCESQAAKAQRPMIFLGLDAVSGGSLYDLLVWFADRARAPLLCDPAAKSYVLAAQKPAKGRQAQIDFEDVAQLAVVLPRVPRHQARVLNGDSRDPTIKATSRKEAQAPLFVDTLVRAPVAADRDARMQAEEARLTPRKPEIHAAFARAPLCAIQPGDEIDLRKDTQWATSGLAVPPAARQEALRVVSVDLSLRSRAPAFSSSGGGHTADMEGCLRATLEPLSETCAHLPPYAPPPGPRLVEGQIVSEIGGEEQETYDIQTEEKTSLDRYRVRVPLWDKQIVTAPFQAEWQPGHFYFPAYRDARVLLSLDFAEARLCGFLDWRRDGRLPKDTQGNQLLMGKAKDDSTALRLAYKDQLPVFTLERVSKQDRQTLELREGGLRIEVREEKKAK